MKNVFIRTAALAGACMAIAGVSAQEPQKPEAQLRFDQAQREEVADQAPYSDLAAAAAGRPFAYKLNRKRTTEAVAYDAVTLWNVRKVRVKNRRMRLSDTTRREKVRLLKFFTERSRKKGARPHLLGNVAGYNWFGGEQYDPKSRKMRYVPKYIGSYTLRDEYEAARKALGNELMFKVPDELWRELSDKAVYELDGVRVPGSIFQFIDGLVLRTLEIHTDDETMARYGTDQGVVIGDIYPDRRPLVIFDGEFSTLESWLKICHTNAFSMAAAVPMRYFYMLPVEAVQKYGRPGKYGAICIELAE